MDGENNKKHHDIVYAPWISAEDIPYLKQDFGKSTAVQHDCDKHHQNGQSKIISMPEQDKLTPELRPPAEMRKESDRDSFNRRWLALARDSAMAHAATEQAHQAREYEYRNLQTRSR